MLVLALQFSRSTRRRGPLHHDGGGLRAAGERRARRRRPKPPPISPCSTLSESVKTDSLKTEEKTKSRLWR